MRKERVCWTPIETNALCIEFVKLCEADGVQLPFARGQLVDLAKRAMFVLEKGRRREMTTASSAFLEEYYRNYLKKQEEVPAAKIDPTDTDLTMLDHIEAAERDIHLRAIELAHEVYRSSDQYKITVKVIAEELATKALSEFREKAKKIGVLFAEDYKDFGVETHNIPISQDGEKIATIQVAVDSPKKPRVLVIGVTNKQAANLMDSRKDIAWMFISDDVAGKDPWKHTDRVRAADLVIHNQGCPKPMKDIVKRCSVKPAKCINTTQSTILAAVEEVFPKKASKTA